MSLELQIETLNSNIVALIGALAGIGREAPVAEPVRLNAKPKAVLPPADEPNAPAAVQYTFDDARKMVLRLAAKDRVKAKSLLEKYGASKISELAESNYGAFIFAAGAELGD